MKAMVEAGEAKPEDVRRRLGEMRQRMAEMRRGSKLNWDVVKRRIKNAVESGEMTPSKRTQPTAR